MTKLYKKKWKFCFETNKTAQQEELFNRFPGVGSNVVSKEKTTLHSETNSHCSAVFYLFIYLFLCLFLLIQHYCQYGRRLKLPFRTFYFNSIGDESERNVPHGGGENEDDVILSTTHHFRASWFISTGTRQATASYSEGLSEAYDWRERFITVGFSVTPY